MIAAQELQQEWMTDEPQLKTVPRDRDETIRSLLYLVHITLSAIILRRRQTQALGVLACLCFALLFRFYHEMGIRLTQVTAIGRIRAEWKITGGT